VFVLVDENQSASTVFAAGSAAPYLSQTLVAQGAFLPNFYAIGHDSLDNYIAMVSGQAPNPLTSADCSDFVNFPADSLDAAGQVNGTGCVYPTDVPSLMSQFDAAGLTWRGYQEGMGADPTRELPACGHPIVGTPDNTQAATAQDQYMTHHDPFVYFHYVIDNQTECNANVVNLSRLPTDLRSAATTPNYVFITPNACNDGHDAPCANGQRGGLAQADSFLKTWVPVITSSPAFQQSGLLIITFDEAVGDSSACCNEVPGPYDASNQIQPGGSGPGGGVVGAVLLSPAIAPGTTSTASYNHYSMLASVEDLFGLPRIGDAVGANALGPDVYTQPNGVVAWSGTSAGGGWSGTPGKSGPRVGAPRLRLIISRQIVPSRRAASIAKLLNAHGCSLRFRAPEPGRVLVQWYEVPAGAKLAATGRREAVPVLIASGQALFRSAAVRTIKLRLTHAGKQLLRHTKRLKLTAKGTFTPWSGRAVSARRTFVLRT
jgi:phosphatidylinositol-3-phosphatase